MAGEQLNPDQTAFSAPKGNPGDFAAEPVIGPFHLIRMLGEGGMGQVWLAEQTEPVRRRVAIKLIKAGMDTREVVSRFESERQALALMDHPAIAKVFEAGATPAGRPYFVMEYVDGIPITVYCDYHKLTMRQRLQLFIEVCEGVQHAHQKAIIHRDLKPSNILVSEVDGKPMPRIIDFGVAKAMSQEPSAETMFTLAGMVVGTPGYMSPEQAGTSGQDIDTRSDVYSLGVVLYELLVGQLPLDFRKLAFEEVMRRLREEDAPRPSTRLRLLGADSAVTAQNRGVDLPLLVRQMRGDADAIALKALEKDRRRRYATPSELAADIGRYLRDEPVSAHAPSALYRAQKYIRRHRLGVAVAGMALVLLIAFAVAQAIALRRVTRERDRADRISEFMTGIFKISNPSVARGNAVTARELLDKGSQQIDEGLRGDPELQAKMMYTMANTYYGLGLSAQSQPLLERALETQRRLFGVRHRDTLRSMSYLAMSNAENGHRVEAEKLARETLQLQREVMGPEHPDTLSTQFRLAVILHYAGNNRDAEQVCRELLATDRRALGPDDPMTLRVLSYLSDILLDEGRYPEAEAIARESIDRQRRKSGADSPDTLRAQTDLGLILLDEGRFPEAEQVYRETVAADRRVFGAENRVTLNTMGGYAAVLNQEHRGAEAESLQRQTVEMQSRVLGPENRETLISMTMLANTLASEGKMQAAEQLERQTLEKERRVLGPSNQRTLVSLGHEGVYLAHMGRYAEAQKLFREGIDTATQAKQPGQLADVWYNFACAAASAGRKEEALQYLERAIDLGYTGADWIAADEDLVLLHGDSRFDALLVKARRGGERVTGR